MHLTTTQIDRACGSLLAAACGDALGAGYEFGSATPGPEGPRMIGGGLGGFAPGQWTDDTSMLVAIAEVAATGADLRTEEALDGIARAFLRWYDDGPPDIGIQTSQVLGAARVSASSGDSDASGPSRAMADAARRVHDRAGRSGGNGSLMRTAPVALAHLDDPDALVEAALAVSALTHHDPQAGEACALWCLAIRRAVLTGELDLRDGVPLLPEASRGFWEARIDEAESREPGTFTPNGYVVTALQAAWSAIVHSTGSAGVGELVETLSTAISIGDDTDTVAAIAGALVGARWGASAVPAEWRRVVHGWPGLRAEDLVRMATLIVTGGEGIVYGWPKTPRISYGHWNDGVVAVPHPYDDRVLLGNASALSELERLGVTAVVTLCLVGTDDVPAGIEHVTFRLIDKVGAEHNANLDHVIDDAARTIRALREDGHTVLLHCVAAQSRTPTVATRYAHLLGVPHDQALRAVCESLPSAAPNRDFRAALERLAQINPGV